MFAAHTLFSCSDLQNPKVSAPTGHFAPTTNAALLQRMWLGRRNIEGENRQPFNTFCNKIGLAIWIKGHHKVLSRTILIMIHYESKYHIPVDLWLFSLSLPHTITLLIVDLIYLPNKCFYMPFKNVPNHSSLRLDNLCATKFFSLYFHSQSYIVLCND